ncbi:MAG: hypothetical protein U5L72_11600 [Bacteroidales bacterium]|nr:hypothetical protein [Bacteroidales bacterium]
MFTYDFGDAIRTATNRAHAQLRRPSPQSTMDSEIYRAYAEGYLLGAMSTLDASEIEYLPFTPKASLFI